MIFLWCFFLLKNPLVSISKHSLALMLSKDLSLFARESELLNSHLPAQAPSQLMTLFFYYKVFYIILM